MPKVRRVVSASFTRPANTTAYTAGDVVSNDATTTVPMVFTGVPSEGKIVGARLETDKKSITPAVKVNLLYANDGTIAGDNAAHKEVYADVAKRIGSFTFAAMTTPTDTSNSDISRAEKFDLDIPIGQPQTLGTIYAILEDTTGFTPASGQQFTLRLIIEQE